MQILEYFHFDQQSNRSWVAGKYLNDFTVCTFDGLTIRSVQVIPFADVLIVTSLFVWLSITAINPVPKVCKYTLFDPPIFNRCTHEVASEEEDMSPEDPPATNTLLLYANDVIDEDKLLDLKVKEVDPVDEAISPKELPSNETPLAWNVVVILPPLVPNGPFAATQDSPLDEVHKVFASPPAKKKDPPHETEFKLFGVPDVLADQEVKLDDDEILPPFVTITCLETNGFSLNA